MKFMRGVLAGLFAFAMGSAEATLIDRGGGLIYDSDLNITWLQDANYAKTSGYDADGKMTWGAANTWADNLVYHDSVRNLDYSDWRLPSALNQDGTDPCVGTDCNSSEMGHLSYVDLAVTAWSSILSSTDPDLALFRNVQSYAYWSGPAMAYIPATYAWHFHTDLSFQSYVPQNTEFFAWAVRDGDVANVPEPTTLALLGIALAGLGVTRRRKQS